MIMTENKPYEYAEAATATTGELNLINLQLSSWEDARDIFNNIDKNNYKIEKLLTVIDILCKSLSQLAGANVSGKERTPGLINLYEQTLKNEKGWDLTSEQPELYKILKTMSNIYGEQKHYSPEHKRMELLSRVTYESVEYYIECTKQIWIWVLTKRHPNGVPDDQLKSFK